MAGCNPIMRLLLEAALAQVRAANTVLPTKEEPAAATAGPHAINPQAKVTDANEG